MLPVELWYTCGIPIFIRPVLSHVDWYKTLPTNNTMCIPVYSRQSNSLYTSKHSIHSEHNTSTIDSFLDCIAPWARDYFNHCLSRHVSLSQRSTESAIESAMNRKRKCRFSFGELESEFEAGNESRRLLEDGKDKLSGVDVNCACATNNEF